MADRRARELERRARNGDPRAAAGLLRERRRAGALSEEQLQVAALLGHPAARLALGQPERGGLGATPLLHELIALAELGPAGVHQALLSLTRLRAECPPRDAGARRLLALLTRCPDGAALEALLERSGGPDDLPRTARGLLLRVARSLLGSAELLEGDEDFTLLGEERMQRTAERLRAVLRRDLLPWALGTEAAAAAAPHER